MVSLEPQLSASSSDEFHSPLSPKKSLSPPQAGPRRHQLWFLLSVATSSLAVAAIGLAGFWGCDFISPQGISTQTGNPRGYTAWELLGFCAWLVASPVAVSASMGGILLVWKAGKQTSVLRCSSAVAVLSVAAILLMSIGYFVLEGRQMLSCGFVLCYTADVSAVDPTGFKATVGSGVFFFGLLLLFLAGFLSKEQTLAMCFCKGQQPKLEEDEQDKEVQLQDSLKRAARRQLARLVLPGLLVLCGVLPNMWEGFSRGGRLKKFMGATAGISGTMISEKPDAWMVTLNWRWSHSVVVKFFPDTVLFYVFLEMVVLVTALQAEFPGFAKLLSRKVGPAKLGHFLLGTWFAVFLAMFVRYWAVDHLYHGDGKFNMYPLEVAARTCGVTAVMLLGLLLLPASKSSPVLTAAGSSWESAVWIHILLGVLFLMATCGHVALYLARFAELGHLSDILPFNAAFFYPMNPVGGKTPSDNWTVPMMSAVFWPSLVCFGIFPWFRRGNYELFRYTHYMSVILVPATLWHATNAWYFVLPGVLLWTVDRVVRLCGACEVVRVQEMEPLEVSAAAAMTEETEQTKKKKPMPAERVTKVAFTWPGQARTHSPSMFVMVNFPQISFDEWHPFSLSSSPLDSIATIHVKDMGEGSFSGRLHKLALAASKLPHGVVMNVQGPYGSRVNLHESQEVVLVAGGIGITPMVSVLRCAVQQGLRAKQSKLRRLRLVWVARSPGVFDMFAKELSIQAAGLPFPVEISLFCSACSCSSPEDGSGAGILGPITAGRPNFQQLFENENPGGEQLLVLACGPAAMVAECKKAAHSSRADFEDWSFVL
ncbi:unnamed protein product [Polarella glacialis]|uniref:FAD-binding FR-type domain-containing protein n=1 Tax=Polarella glacialis TaxID=89957 RepID=A0A813IK66_POLGL|nr:unnamed protein product [Polarella glacialis]